MTAKTNPPITPPTGILPTLVLADGGEREARHRAHCTLCAAADGREPAGATAFVDALYRAYAPNLREVRLPPRLPNLLSRRDPT